MSGSRAKPAEGILTLAGLVKDFRVRLGPEGPLEDGYLPWMRSSENLRVAVDRAVRSRKPNGKMHGHQTRVPLSALIGFGHLIYTALSNTEPRSFHDLFVRCRWEGERVEGIGPVTTYDVAQRLGAWYRMEPDRTYLHAGVKLGAEALGIPTKGRSYLQSSDLPTELRKLTPDEVEDFLCVYRGLFWRFK